MHALSGADEDANADEDKDSVRDEKWRLNMSHTIASQRVLRAPGIDVLYLARMRPGETLLMSSYRPVLHNDRSACSEPDKQPQESGK